MKSLVQYSISFIKVFNVCAPRGVLSRAGALECSAKFPTPEACSTERALASACQNLCYGYREFWWAFASASSVEHASVSF